MPPRYKSKALPARGAPPLSSSSLSASTAATPSGAAAGPSSTDSDEMCPVCKTLRYLNKEMVFQISPECYHPMCTVCVDRLFEAGPAQCPYAGCLKTLRRKQFREAFFGDLSIEREVDIRRRVAAVFNKRASDFSDLRSYNDYLEMVECLVFDLVSGTEAERAKAEGKLMDWERQHREEIEAIRRARGDEREMRKLKLAREREEERRRKEMMAKEDEEEKLAKERGMTELIDAVANSTTADGPGKVILKKRGRQHLDAGASSSTATSAAAAAAAAGSTEGTNLSIRGLKKVLTPAERLRAKERQGPYSPFQGVRLGPQRYPALEDKGVYHHVDLERYMNHDDYRVPGYSPAEYYRRAMFDAFGGLGLMIGDDEDEDQDENGVSGGVKKEEEEEEEEKDVKVKVEVE